MTTERSGMSLETEFHAWWNEWKAAHQANGVNDMAIAWSSWIGRGKLDVKKGHQALFTGTIDGKPVGLHGTIESVEALEEHLSRDAVLNDAKAKLRTILGERNYREDGDLVTLIDRIHHMSRSDRDNIECNEAWHRDNGTDNKWSARPAAVPDVIPDELKKLSEAATPGEWRSMREGNQSIGARYLPTAKPVAASRIDGPTRPWNPHAAIAFGMKAELHEAVRFTDEDADFVCGAVNWVRAMLAQRDGGTK